jgi:hypothetical protein
VQRRLGDAAGWTIDTYLLAHVVDGVFVGNWQRQGKKGAKRPEAVPRPKRTSNRAAASTLPSGTAAKLLEFRDRRRREVTTGG